MQWGASSSCTPSSKHCTQDAFSLTQSGVIVGSWCRGLASNLFTFNHGQQSGFSSQHKTQQPLMTAITVTADITIGVTHYYFSASPASSLVFEFIASLFEIIAVYSTLTATNYD